MYKPQLPTDNLYKFMSLTGLSLVVITTVFYLLVQFEITGNVTKLQLTFEDLIKRYDSTIAIHVTDEMKLRDVTKLNIDSLGTKIEKIRNIHDQYEKELFNIVGKQTAYSALLNKISYIGLLGLVLSAWGFSFWYNRVQIYQDQKLKHEVETLASKLKPSYQPLVKRSQNVR